MMLMMMLCNIINHQWNDKAKMNTEAPFRSVPFESYQIHFEPKKLVIRFEIIFYFLFT